MVGKAVFLDRDDTLIEDPGYISDPGQVKLMPGVELAIRSLHEAGYQIIVVTNQSAIARGMLTEETLERIHAEVRRQLSAKGVHVDAIYFCPFHPEGTVEQYAIDSDLRKPRPGMLLKAAADLDLDLARSWMVGDSPRDIEAGLRAGCRTIRIRTKGPTPSTLGELKDEPVQADFTVRNLVDAARVILREPAVGGSARPTAGEKSSAPARPAAPSEAPAPAPAGPAPAPAAPPREADNKVLLEILAYVRQLARSQAHEEFSLTRLLAGVAQMAAMAALLAVVWFLLRNSVDSAKISVGVAAVFQVMALTLFVMNRSR